MAERTNAAGCKPAALTGYGGSNPSTTTMKVKTSEDAIKEAARLLDMSCETWQEFNGRTKRAAVLIELAKELRIREQFDYTPL